MKPATDLFPEIWAGLECSINRVGDTYFNQLDSSGHFLRSGDIEAFIHLGIKKIRYPVLWEQHQPDKNLDADFSISASNLLALKNAGVEVIAGLVHHGSGPAYVNIMDESFIQGLVKYAEQVAVKFPWINWYTPVNEPLTTARFCGLYGLWYPHENNAASFCRILINELKATVLAMQAIRRINPTASLLHTDDLGKTHSTLLLQYQADFENNRRWLSYDLLCGKVNEAHPLWNYLISSGIGKNELDFFTENLVQPSILGFNHYMTSERYIDENLTLFPEFSYGGNGIHSYADIEAVRVGHICPDGLHQLLYEAWVRFELPMAVTEVHLYCTREEQMRWLFSVWETARKLRAQGVNILAVTPWALIGSFDWNSLLTKASGHYEPGVFDISDFIPRHTILAKMIHAYSRNEPFYHPVLLTRGWWERSCRALYGRDLIYTGHEDVDVRPVLILGNGSVFRNEITSLCNLRGLSSIFYSPGSINTADERSSLISSHDPWAIIWSGSSEDAALLALSEECQQRRIKLLVIYCAEELFFMNLQQAFIIDAQNFDVFLNTDHYPAQTHQPMLENFRKFINSSLDFLLDDEYGCWISDKNGHLTNLVKEPVIGTQTS